MSEIGVISLKRREMYHLLPSPARLPNICIDDDRAEQRSHATCCAGTRVPGGLYTCARRVGHGALLVLLREWLGSSKLNSNTATTPTTGCCDGGAAQLTPSCPG